MSNKLKKKSPCYGEAKNRLIEMIKKEGGLNIEPSVMKQFTENEDETKCISQDEFFDILSELSEGEYKLYKVSQVHHGKEERGLMICNKETIIAFVKDPAIKNKEEDKKEAE